MQLEGLANGVLEAVADRAPSSVAELDRLLGRADDVDDEDSRENPIGVLDVAPRTGYELLDRTEKLRGRERPVIGAVELHETRAGDVLGEVQTVARAHVRVVPALDHQRRSRDKREHVTQVELVNRPRLRKCHPRCPRKAFDASPPLDDPGTGCHRGRERRGEGTCPPCRLDHVEHVLLCAVGHPGWVVIVPSEAGEAVVKHERLDPLWMRRRRHERHLGCMPLCNQRRALEAGGVHHRGHVVDPVLGCCRPARHRIGHPDAAHVERENARKAGERSQELLHERLLPQRFEVARPVEDKDHVVLALSENLIGELDLSAMRVLGTRRHQAHSARRD